jgi:hypothetical protein
MCGRASFPPLLTGAPLRRRIVYECIAEFDQVRELILQAGMDLGLDRNDREVVRVELFTGGEKVPASSLIIERSSTTYYSFDPEPRVRESRSRRGMLDRLMRDQVIEQAEHQAPLIPAG